MAVGAVTWSAGKIWMKQVPLEQPSAQPSSLASLAPPVLRLGTTWNRSMMRFGNYRLDTRVIMSAKDVIPQVVIVERNRRCARAAHAPASRAFRSSDDGRPDGMARPDSLEETLKEITVARSMTCLELSLLRQTPGGNVIFRQTQMVVMNLISFGN